MKQSLLGFVVGFLILGSLAGAIYQGTKKHTPPSAIPVVPEEPRSVVPPTPVPPTPVPPAPKEYSASFRHGYHDGYSGSWLSPARWMVASEYRAGWHAGNQDRVANKPNMFR